MCVYVGMHYARLLKLHRQMPHCNYSRKPNRKSAITKLQEQKSIYVYMCNNNIRILIAFTTITRVVGAAADIKEATAAQP